MVGTWQAWSIEGTSLGDLSPVDITEVTCGEELRAAMAPLRACFQEQSCVKLTVPVAEWTWSPHGRAPLPFAPVPLRTGTQPQGGNSATIEVGTQTYRIIAISDERFSMSLEHPKGLSIKLHGIGLTDRHVLGQYQPKTFVNDTTFMLVPHWQTDAPETEWTKGEYTSRVDGDACVGVFLLRDFSS
jgi:hypothetical protein